jgi:HD-GYP domain-containing protein (c-di-GMP phosphodiesterase class II)
VREPGPERLRLADLLAALSLATDLGNGMPLERTMRTALMAVEVGRNLGLPDRGLSNAFYLALLRAIGCTAFAHEEAQAYGDDVTYRWTYFPVDFGREEEVVAATRENLARGQSAAARDRAIARFFADGPRLASEMAATACSVAVRFASRLGMSDAVGRGLTHIWERWDGKGFPGGLAEDEIEMSARLVTLANVVEIDHRTVGRDAACENVARRSGGWFDPSVAGSFLDCAPDVFGLIESESVWELVLESEPSPSITLPMSRLDEVTSAFADFADLKSPYLVGHSGGVARLASAAAGILGLGDEEQLRLRRAGLLHDLGRVSVSNGIWDKPGSLGAAEWERVRLHAYYSERVVSQSPVLAPLAGLVGMHHERLDGSGYHRGAPASQLARGPRLLAVADVFQALTEERPHRPARSTREAVGVLEEEVDAGRLDRDAVRAVAEAAGERARRSRGPWPAGLTEREVEVLRLLARGRSQRQIADELVISPSTAHTHIVHIYGKCGVSTRASVALFAMENDLIAV